MTAAPAGRIGTRAASERAARLWKAYSRGYDLAGRWHTLRIVVNVALAVGGIVIARSRPDGSAVLAVIAGAWTLLARECLIVAEGRERRKAVNAQELFDTYVFELPWNTGLAGPAPAEEDVIRAAVKNRRPAPTGTPTPKICPAPSM